MFSECLVGDGAADPAAPARHRREERESREGTTGAGRLRSCKWRISGRKHKIWSPMGGGLTDTEGAFLVSSDSEDFPTGLKT